MITTIKIKQKELLSETTLIAERIFRLTEEYIKGFGPDIFGCVKTDERTEEVFFDMTQKLRAEAMRFADVSDSLTVLRDAAMLHAEDLLKLKKSPDSAEALAKELQRQAATVSAFYDMAFEDYSRSVYSEITKSVANVGNIKQYTSELKLKLNNYIKQL